MQYYEWHTPISNPVYISSPIIYGATITWQHLCHPLKFLLSCLANIELASEEDDQKLVLLSNSTHCAIL